MPEPPMLQGPFRVPSFNGYIPRRLQPWIYFFIAFCFLMSSGIYGGAMSQVMGEYSLMREDVLMIIMFNVVGVAMPLPFISLDYLGLFLWSAWMLEFIFFFNYGEHYNWFESDIMWMDLMLFIVTGYFCINRMLHIRHPYIEPAAWKYKRLVPLLILFAFVEFMGSTPKVLQTTFTGGVLHFGIVTTNVLNFVEWVGAIAGCLFCLFWCKVLHQKYTRLLTLGVAAMALYPVMMYFLIDPDLPIEALYLPTFSRSFGNAIFFVMLTVYLEELMPFQHFFMGLTMAGIVRIIAVAVLLIFLLWDIQPVRSTLKKMPAWNFVGKRMKKKKGFKK